MKFSVLILMTALLAGASSNVHATENVVDFEAVIQQFQQRLKQQLTQAVEQGGLTGAVQVCATQAPLIAAQLSRQHGVKLQRVSARFRNPINMPSTAQQKILDYLASNPLGADSYYTTDGEQHGVYAKSIRTEGLCLGCHGQSVDAKVLHSIQSQYPFDLATGYQEGDLRGAFVIQSKQPTTPFHEIKNLKMLSQNLWVGGQPLASQMASLQAQGIGTIINLRTADEMEFDEQASAKRLGINYQNIPVAGSADITLANSSLLRDALERATGPVYLHCASSNRVGALLALGAFQQGTEVAAALAFGEMAGMTSLATAVADTLAEKD